MIFFTVLLFVNSFFSEAADVQNDAIVKQGTRGMDVIERGEQDGKTLGNLFNGNSLSGLSEDPLSVEELLRKFSDDEDNSSPPSVYEPPPRLHSAVSSKDINRVEWLAETMDINERDSQDFTPFLTSIMAQDFEIMEFFLNHPNTDLSAKDMLGNNVFHLLFLSPNDPKRGKTRREVLALLLKEEHFIKISSLLNGPNGDGQTALDLLYREYIYGAHIITNHELKQLVNRGAEITLDLYQMFKSDEISDAERMRVIKLTQQVKKHTDIEIFALTEEDVADLIKLSKSYEISDIDRKKIKKLIEQIRGHQGAVAGEEKTVEPVQKKEQKKGVDMSLAANAVQRREQGIPLSAGNGDREVLGLAQEEAKDADVFPADKVKTASELFLEVINSSNTRERTLEQIQIFIDSGYNLEEQILYHGYNFLRSLISAEVDIHVIEELMKYKRIGINDRDGFGMTLAHRLVENLNFNPTDLYSKKVLSLLLSHPEIDLEIRNKEGKTALELSEREFVREKISNREKELKEMSKADRYREFQQLKTPAYICQNTFR